MELREAGVLKLAGRSRLGEGAAAAVVGQMVRMHLAAKTRSSPLAQRVSLEGTLSELEGLLEGAEALIGMVHLVQASGQAAGVVVELKGALMMTNSEGGRGEGH